MRTASERGSALPLYVGLVAVFLIFTASIVDVASLFLFRQHLQSAADQQALSRFNSGERTSGNTFEVQLCRTWQMPIKAIGLPTAQHVCARSAAR